MGRGDVDDPPAALGLHDGNGRPAGVKGGGQDHRDQGVPLLLRELVHRRHVLDAGVVDQDVQPPKLAHRVGDEVLDLLRPGHVGGMVADGGVGAGLQGLPVSLDLRRIPQAIEDDVDPLLSEGGGEGLADAAGGARDDRHVAFKLVVDGHGPTPFRRRRARVGAARRPRGQPRTPRPGNDSHRGRRPSGRRRARSGCRWRSVPGRPLPAWRRS